MTDPKLAHTFDWGRMYSRDRGGTPEVPSITTVLDVLNQNMEWWEALCATRLAMEHAEALASILHMPDGPERWDRNRAAKDWLQGAAERDRNEASRRGDFVHDYAETWGLHQLGEATSNDVARQEALCERAGVSDHLRHFHAFWDHWNPTVLQPEATVWNKTVGYAGTTDLICTIEVDGENVVTVMDWKTKKGLYKRNGAPKDTDLRDFTGMQLAAAAFAEEIWLPGDSPEADAWEPFPYEVEVGCAVAIAPDGYVVRQFAIHNPLMWQTFRALRAAWNFRRDGNQLMSESLSGPDQIRRRPRAA